MPVKTLLNLIGKSHMYKCFTELGIIDPEDRVTLEYGRVHIREREDGVPEIQINIPFETEG